MTEHRERRRAVPAIAPVPSIRSKAIMLRLVRRSARSASTERSNQIARPHVVRRRRGPSRENRQWGESCRREQDGHEVSSDSGPHPRRPVAHRAQRPPAAAERKDALRLHHRTLRRVLSLAKGRRPVHRRPSRRGRIPDRRGARPSRRAPRPRRSSASRRRSASRATRSFSRRRSRSTATAPRSRTAPASCSTSTTPNSSPRWPRTTRTSRPPPATSRANRSRPASRRSAPHTA